MKRKRKITAKKWVSDAIRYAKRPYRQKLEPHIPVTDIANIIVEYAPEFDILRFETHFYTTMSMLGENNFKNFEEKGGYNANRLVHAVLKEKEEVQHWLSNYAGYWGLFTTSCNRSMCCRGIGPGDCICDLPLTRETLKQIARKRRRT